MNLVCIFTSIAGVAKKEFLHILRDWRVLVLILTLPMAFTLLFGYAFEDAAITDAPALLRDNDHSPESQKLIERLKEDKTFAWQDWGPDFAAPVDLLGRGVLMAVEIPPNWGHSLGNGDPQPLPLDQAADDGRAEGGMVHVGVARDDDHVALRPPQSLHFGTRGRQEQRRRPAGAGRLRRE